MRAGSIISTTERQRLGSVLIKFAGLRPLLCHGRLSQPRLLHNPNLNQFIATSSLSMANRCQKGLKNSITLNHEYFIRRFVAEHHVIFEQKDERFYFFDSTDGAWHPAHYDVCRKLVRCNFVRMAREEFRNDKLMLKATDATLNAITSGVRVVCGTRDQFKRLPRGLIHCANGMFQLHPTGKVEQFAFSPAYFSRNPLPLAYRSKRTVPEIH